METLEMNTQPTKKDINRFWKYVDTGKDDDCWEWSGGRGSNQYGRMSYQCKSMSMHRFSWMIHNGSIPNGMLILHHCDNPPCVNPKHLFMGTQQDNMDDMINKGRAIAPKGEVQGHSKLNADQVRAIRQLYATGKYLQRELGEMYGVHGHHIGSIVRREWWKHIT